MRVALLCTGPSLPQQWADEYFDEFELIIALNTAGHRYRHHYLCGADRHIMLPMLTAEPEDKICRPFKGVITNSAYGRASMKQHLEWIRLPLQNGDYNEQRWPALCKAMNTRVCAYSMPNALYVALERAGNEPLHIFGMDCSQETLDFSGQKGDHSRNRWIQETAWLRVLWNPSTVVHGNASPEVLDYLCSRRSEHPFTKTP